MLGENLIIGQDFEKIAEKLKEIFISQINGSTKKFIITVAGESGSGKSGISKSLADYLTGEGIKTIIIQQDDYFLFPPQTNEMKRHKDINRVGPEEVNLKLLQYHVDLINKNEEIIKPLVIFDENKITEEKISLPEVKVVIVEGTYTSVLENISKKIFIDRIYLETKKERIIKAREKQDRFLENVLEIEHKIISKHKEKANIIITKEFEIIE